MAFHCSLLFSTSRQGVALRGSVRRMPTYITMKDESQPKQVKESVEEVTQKIRSAGQSSKDKFVILTHVDGGKVALVADNVVQALERDS